MQNSFETKLALLGDKMDQIISMRENEMPEVNERVVKCEDLVRKLIDYVIRLKKQALTQH